MFWICYKKMLSIKMDWCLKFQSMNQSPIQDYGMLVRKWAQFNLCGEKQKTEDL